MKSKTPIKALWLLLIIFACSCGTMNKIVHKNKQKEEIKTETVTKEVTKTDTETAINRTVTEITHTTIEIPESRMKDSIDLARLFTGEDFEQENEDLKITIHVDPVTKKLTTEAISKKKVIQASGEKTTVEAIKQNKSEEKNIDQNIKEQKKTLNKSKVKEVEIDTSIPWYFWVILFIFIIVVGYLVLKYWLHWI